MQYVGPELYNSNKRQQQPEEEQNSARNDAFAEFAMYDECGQHLQKKAMFSVSPHVEQTNLCPKTFASTNEYQQHNERTMSKPPDCRYIKVRNASC